MTQINLNAGRQHKSRDAVSADSEVLTRLLNTTPDQAETWVNANVNDLATAKQVLAKVVKAMVFLMQKELD